MRRSTLSITRRGFLGGSGALVVGFSLADGLPSAAEAVTVRPAPGAPPGAGQLDSWLRVSASGAVEFTTGRVELGQGNATALAQIVAEELDVPFERVTMVMGDTATSIDQGETSGSSTVRSAGGQLRLVAAYARRALLDVASERLGVPADRLQVAGGVVSVVGDPSTTVTYGKLVGGRTINREIPVKTTPSLSIGGDVKPKDPGQYTIVGRSIPRTDVQPKVTARFTYVQDVRVPGMLHGRVVRPAGIGSTVISVDGFREHVPGARLVHLENFVGVVAEREWDAIRAARALKVTWSDWKRLPGMDDLYTTIRQSSSTDMTYLNRGNLGDALGSAAVALSATYETPFETHGSIGPSCAVASVTSEQVTIWSGTQYPHGLQRDIATLLGIDAGRIRVINAEAAGCYGRNGADHAAADAVLLSRAVRRPVRVQWMRHDEHGWDPKGPAMVQDMRGGIDAQGNVVAWSHEVWSPTHADGTLIAAALTGKKVGRYGIGAFGSPTLLYGFPTVLTRQHQQGDFMDALRTAWLRTPAQYQTTFAMESFMDEVAAAAGQDPVDYRLRYLSDDRAIAVLKAATGEAGWTPRPSPQPGAHSDSTPSGRGVAIAQRGGTYVAEVAEVQVERATGNVRVTRFTVAHDCGLMVNPAAVQAQVESCVIQTTSRALKEEVTLDASNVTSTDWITYPILTFPEVPEIRTVLIDRRDIPSRGAGEPAACPVAAAISNAVFDAIGVRLRRLPMRPERVKEALSRS